jgi:hypothetical protein
MPIYVRHLHCSADGFTIGVSNRVTDNIGAVLVADDSNAVSQPVCGAICIAQPVPDVVVLESPRGLDGLRFYRVSRSQGI